jgi:hypothetical protein
MYPRQCDARLVHRCRRMGRKVEIGKKKCNMGVRSAKGLSTTRYYANATDTRNNRVTSPDNWLPEYSAVHCRRRQAIQRTV